MSVFESRVENYKLPDSWGSGRLDEVCDQMKQGKILPQKEIHEIGRHPVFGANGCIGYCDSYFLEEERVLITCRGSTCGTINRSPEKSFVTNNAMILFEKDCLNKDFLFFALQEFSTKGLKTGSGQPQLTKGILNSHVLPLPPLPEQKKIAHILSTVQRAIEAQERIIQTTTELKKTLMRKLFTEGITKDFREDWDISTLKQEIWPMGRLGEYAEFKNGINFTKAQKGEIGVPTVDVKNMYGNGFAVGVDNLYRVDIDIKDDYFLRKGDLLFVRSSLKQEGIGWTNQYLNNSEPTTFCGFIIRARLKDQEITDPSFLTFYFRSDDARRSLITSSGKVAITNISQGILSKSLIPLPPLSEQKKVTQILSTVQQAIEVQESKKATLQDLFRTLLHEMMTAKTRVNDV